MVYGIRPILGGFVPVFTASDRPGARVEDASANDLLLKLRCQEHGPGIAAEGLAVGLLGPPCEDLQ